MLLESREYSFLSPYSSDQCLTYLKKYNTLLPSRIELKGLHLRAFGRSRGNKFRLSVYNWGLTAPLRWFFGEIIPQEKGCLIRGKFKVRWVFSIIALIFFVLFLNFIVPNRNHVTISDLLVELLFFTLFFGAFFYFLFKLNIFGRYSEEYALEFFKKTFSAELKD